MAAKVGKQPINFDVITTCRCFLLHLATPTHQPLTIDSRGRQKVHSCGMYSTAKAR